MIREKKSCSLGMKQRERYFLASFKTNFRSVNRPPDHGLMPQNTRWQDRPLNTGPGTIMTPRRSHRKSSLVPVQQEGSIVSTIHSRASLCLTTNCFNPSVTSICVSQIVEQYPLARDLIPAGRHRDWMYRSLDESCASSTEFRARSWKWGKKNLGIVGGERNSWSGERSGISEIIASFY